MGGCRQIWEGDHGTGEEPCGGCFWPISVQRLADLGDRAELIVATQPVAIFGPDGRVTLQRRSPVTTLSIS
jgi:hypothetical protein